MGQDTVIKRVRLKLDWSKKLLGGRHEGCILYLAAEFSRLQVGWSETGWEQTRYDI